MDDDLAKKIDFSSDVFDPAGEFDFDGEYHYPIEQGSELMEQFTHFNETIDPNVLTFEVEQQPPEHEAGQQSPEHDTEHQPPQHEAQHLPSDHGSQHLPSDHDSQHLPSDHESRYQPSDHESQRQASSNNSGSEDDSDIDDNQSSVKSESEEDYILGLDEDEYPNFLNMTAEEREEFNQNEFFKRRLLNLNTDYVYSEGDLENEKILNRAIDLVHH